MGRVGEIRLAAGAGIAVAVGEARVAATDAAHAARAQGGRVGGPAGHVASAAVREAGAEVGAGGGALGGAGRTLGDAREPARAHHAQGRRTGTAGGARAAAGRGREVGFAAVAGIAVAVLEARIAAERAHATRAAGRGVVASTEVIAGAAVHRIRREVDAVVDHAVAVVVKAVAHLELGHARPRARVEGGAGQGLTAELGAAPFARRAAAGAGRLEAQPVDALTCRACVGGDAVRIAHAVGRAAGAWIVGAALGRHTVSARAGRRAGIIAGSRTRHALAAAGDQHRDAEAALHVHAHDALGEHGAVLAHQTDRDGVATGLIEIEVAHTSPTQIVVSHVGGSIGRAAGLRARGREHGLGAHHAEFQPRHEVGLEVHAQRALRAPAGGQHQEDQNQRPEARRHCLRIPQNAASGSPQTES